MGEATDKLIIAELEESANRWKARAERAEAEGWRTMDSAPKDGSLFVCWIDTFIYRETDDGGGEQVDASTADLCEWRASDDGGYFDAMAGPHGDGDWITHWRPIAAPTREQIEQARKLEIDAALCRQDVGGENG